MNRRTALKRTGWLVGYSVTLAQATVVLSGCRQEPELTWSPEFLTNEEARTVAAVVDRILPRTDTPGALDVGVPEFIDQMAAKTFTAEEQTKFRAALQELNEGTYTKMKKNFADIEFGDQDAILRDLEEIVIENARNDDQDGEPTLFDTLRGMAIFAYTTSEQIGTEVLNYDPIPGDYLGCMPLSEVPNGRLWSL